VTREPISTQDDSPERAVLVSPRFSDRSVWDSDDALRELRELARTAGAEVVECHSPSVRRPSAATLLGRGALEALRAAVSDTQADLAIFDCDLSPAQQRNVEEALSAKVIDRTQIILDIFAGRARTREGKLQVELAQLNYLLPRLTGRGVLLSRLGGGIGTRGPGETKLEVDRRRIRRRIHQLGRELSAVRRHRDVQRKRREGVPLPGLALVGYTNSGKSTLLNRLTGSDVLTEDLLFATLDPTSRRLTLPNNQCVVISDTVGFIRNLPHHLVAAFRATLEEVVEADLLLHVIDVSHPHSGEQERVVREVLGELGAAQTPSIVVCNKVDLLADRSDLPRVLSAYERAVATSALHGEGLDELLRMVMEVVAAGRRVVRLRIPQARAGVLSRIHEHGRLISEEYEGNDVLVVAEVGEHLAARLAEFVVD